MNLKTLGGRLIAGREQLGISQGALARIAGMAQPSVLAIEEGRTKQTKHIVALALAIRQTPEWLDGGVGDMITHAKLTKPEIKLLARAAVKERLAHGVRAGSSYAAPKVAFDIVRLLREIASPQFIPIIGTVEAGIWRQPEREPFEYTVALVKPKFARGIVAFSVAKGELDRAFAGASRLLCVPVSEAEPLRDGDIIVGHTSRKDGKRETLALQLMDVEGGRRLVRNATKRRKAPPIDYTEKALKKANFTPEYCVIEVVIPVR